MGAVGTERQDVLEKELIVSLAGLRLDLCELQPDAVRYLPAQVPLPLGDTNVQVFLVTPGNDWQELARLPLRVASLATASLATASLATASLATAKPATAKPATGGIAATDKPATSIATTDTATTPVAETTTPNSQVAPPPDATPHRIFGFEKIGRNYFDKSNKRNARVSDTYSAGWSTARCNPWHPCGVERRRNRQ